MESHGLPFVSSAATLSSKWFTCCQNGSVRQVQEVHEEVQGRILNARHYMNGKTGVVVAAQNGHLEVVKFLADVGARLEIPDNRGCTALLRAASESRDDVVRFLLRRRVAKDVVDENGMNMVHYSVVAGSTKVLSIALKAGLSVHSKDALGYTPIMHAVRMGPNEAVTRMLLSRGADCSAVLPNSRGFTPLIMACRCGRARSEVTTLLKWGAWIQERDQDGMTPFLSAVDLQCMDLVRFFLDRGSSPHDERDYKNRNAVAVAMQNLDMDMVHLLMSDSSHPRRVLPAAGKTRRQRLMMTPAQWKALQKKQREERKRLEKETEAEREARKRDERARHKVPALRSPRELLQRARREHPDTQQLERPYKLSKAKKEQWKVEEAARVEAAAQAEEELEVLRAKRVVADALVRGCRLGEPSEVVRALLDGADPDTATSHGYRPVHHAALRGTVASLRFLFLAGADLEAETQLGFRALHLAAMRGHEAFAMRLLEYGADGTAATREEGASRVAPQLAPGSELAARLVAAIEHQSFVRSHPAAAAAHRPAPPMLLCRSASAITFAWPPLLLEPPVARTPLEQELRRRAALHRKERQRVRTTPWLRWGDPERWRGGVGSQRLLPAADAAAETAGCARMRSTPGDAALTPLRRGKPLRRWWLPARQVDARVREGTWAVGRGPRGGGDLEARVDRNGHIVGIGTRGVGAEAVGAAQGHLARVAATPWGDRAGAQPDSVSRVTCGPFHVWGGPEVRAWQVEFSVRRRGAGGDWGGAAGVRVPRSITLEDAVSRAEKALEAEAFVLRERWRWSVRRRGWQRRPAFKPGPGDRWRQTPGRLQLAQSGSAGFRLILSGLLHVTDDLLTRGAGRDPGWCAPRGTASSDVPRGTRFAVRAALGFRPCWEATAPSRQPPQLRIYEGPRAPAREASADPGPAEDAQSEADAAAEAAKKERETAPWRVARVRALSKLAAVSKVKKSSQEAARSAEAAREWEAYKQWLPSRLRPAPEVPPPPRSVLSVATPPPVAHVLCELTLRFYDRTGVVLPLPCDLFAAFDADCGLSLAEDGEGSVEEAPGAPDSASSGRHRDVCGPPLLSTHTICAQPALDTAASVLQSEAPLSSALPADDGHNSGAALVPAPMGAAGRCRRPPVRNTHSLLPYALASAARMRARVAASVDTVLHPEGRELPAMREGRLMPAEDRSELAELANLASGCDLRRGDWVSARIRGWTGTCWTQWSASSEFFQLDEEQGPAP